MTIGEAGCVSVHGANRLGSNLLLDLVVFAMAAAHRAADIVDKYAPHFKLKSDTLTLLLDRFDNMRSAKRKISVADLRLKMQKAMQNHAAVFRTEETLEEGKKLIDSIRKEYQDISIYVPVVAKQLQRTCLCAVVASLQLAQE